MDEKNCISWWLPRLEAAALPVPRTRIVRTDLNLMPWIGGEPVDGADAFLKELHEAVQEMAVLGGGPAFLRSGHFSGKHAWRRTCYIADGGEVTPEALQCHVAEMMEVGECMSIIGFPWGVWAAREYLHPAPGDVAFEASEFYDMPVRRELRVFVRDGRVECYHPYWPENAFRRATPEQLEAVRRIREDADGQRSAALATARRAGEALAAGATRPDDAWWSVDMLHTSRGWYVTDCALGSQSWHWPFCPNGPKEDR